MGMPRGSRWKRLAVFSNIVNPDSAPDIDHLLWANRIEMEWWNRSVPRGKGPRPSRNPINNLMRDEHPHDEARLMVRRGDWPMAFVLAKSLGVSL
jgi:hypothetical protein